MNKFSFVELYAKCIKEGQIEWTKPEKALETTKNTWQKAKLRLIMLSAGAVIGKRRNTNFSVKTVFQKKFFHTLCYLVFAFRINMFKTV